MKIKKGNADANATKKEGKGNERRLTKNTRHRLDWNFGVNKGIKVYFYTGNAQCNGMMQCVIDKKGPGKQNSHTAM